MRESYPYNVSQDVPGINRLIRQRAISFETLVVWTKFGTVASPYFM